MTVACRARASTGVVALMVSVQACMPPGISHGPRVREGMHVAATYVTVPVDDEDVGQTVALALRTGSERRSGGRRGRQFGLVVPVPALTQALDEEEDVGLLHLLTGEYYQETDHPDFERFPRGWGVQLSLLSLAPYGKIGWYGERGGVHLTNAVGAYGGILGVFPPEVLVWWPYLTFEVAPFSRGTGMFHVGGSVQYEMSDRELSPGLMAGATFSFGRAY